MPLSKIDSDSLNTPITAVDLAYTGTLTGGTGVVNLGSGQVYKDASGNVGINTATPGTFGKLAIQVPGTTTPTNASNVGPSSINLFGATAGSDTNGTVGIFGWQNSGPGIGSGIGFSRESSSDWGTQLRFYTHPTSTSSISDITERARLLSNGTLKLGMSNSQSRSDSGVASWNVVGTIANNGTLSFDVTVPYDEGSSVGHHIEANMTHYNWGGYGCIIDTWVATRGTSITEQINLVNVTSGNGGSWTISKPNATTLRVTKNAGTYNGVGYYWIKVTTISVI